MDDKELVAALEMAPWRTKVIEALGYETAGPDENAVADRVLAALEYRALLRVARAAMTLTAFAEPDPFDEDTVTKEKWQALGKALDEMPVWVTW